MLTLVFVCIADQFGRTVNMRVAPRDVAKHFSVESIYEPNPWGIHKPWLYFRGKDLLRLMPECPELAVILPENKRIEAEALAKKQK